MRLTLPSILAISLSLGLAACAEREVRPDSSGATPAATGKVAAPPDLDGSLAAPPPPGGTAPEGAAAPPAARSASEEDIASCYRYARATVAHDRRIEQDRGDPSGFGSLGSDVGAFSDRLSQVGESSTFDRAYASCMESKGLRRQ